MSLRRFSLSVTVAVVAFFAISSLFPPTTAYADGVARSGDNITYQGNTYSPAATSDLPSDVVKKAPNTTGYRYIDATNNKAYFILTSGDASKATSGYYVVYTFTPPSNYSDPSPPQTVAIPAASDDNSTDTAKETSSCDGSTMGGIGWLVCPTVNFIAKGMDKIYDIISGFLEVKTMTGDPKSSIYQLWSIIRDVANVAFVIAFIVIVYSQITSVGISNHGLKRMLPRLIIAAGLVNVSFWICAAAVDASNILGYSIHNLFVGLMNKFSVGGNYAGSIPTWQQVSAVALAGTGVVAGGLFVAANTISGTIFLLIPFLLGVVIAALVALLVLAARQALITILVIVAPLAFVAYILPNTEKYFHKWREGMTTLLLLFPIFSVLFSGAQLAGMAIVQSAGGNLFTIILGMAVQVAPIVITPMLVKFSGSLIGKVAGMMNDAHHKTKHRTRDWAQGMAAERKNKVLADQNRYFRRNPLNRATKALDSRRRRIEGKRKAYEAMADNRFAGTKQGQTVEAMNRHAANEKQRVENVFANSQQGRQLEVQSRHLGVEKQEIENSMLRSTSGQHLTHRQHMAEIDKTRVSNEFEESSLGHQVDRAKRVVEAGKKRIENTHQAEWDEAVRTDPHLKNLELSVKASEIRASAEKAKLEKMHAEIAVEGDKSEHVMHLRGADPALQQGILKIAKDINQQHVETSLTNMAKNAAEHKLSTQVNDILSENTVVLEGKTVRKYAAGIGSEAGVFASAIAKGRKDFAEEVSYQKELYSHFKLNADQLYGLAVGKTDATVKNAKGEVVHTFNVNDEHVRDMAAEEIFTIGSHNQKLDILKSTGEGMLNYDYRRTIQQAAIKSNIAAIAPAIADVTLDEIIRGNFKGDESWMYHSLREIMEGRLSAGKLSTANAASLNMLFADVSSDPAAKAQYEKLIDAKVASKLKEDPTADRAAVRAEMVDLFNTERESMRGMAAQALSTPTIRQNTNAQSAEVLKKFAGGLYKGD